ncbi:MAG: hypothetical protein CW691_09290, partial [Candidatus Bathyarchaeum sp.]
MNFQVSSNNQYTIGKCPPEQELSNEFWSFGEYELVGHGKQTNSSCGKFLGFRGCARVDLHNKITLDGVNYAGKVFVQKI